MNASFAQSEKVWKDSHGAIGKRGVEELEKVQKDKEARWKSKLDPSDPADRSLTPQPSLFETMTKKLEKQQQEAGMAREKIAIMAESESFGLTDNYLRANTGNYGKAIAQAQNDLQEMMRYDAKVGYDKITPEQKAQTKAIELTIARLAKEQTRPDWLKGNLATLAIPTGRVLDDVGNIAKAESAKNVSPTATKKLVDGVWRTEGLTGTEALGEQLRQRNTSLSGAIADRKTERVSVRDASGKYRSVELPAKGSMHVPSSALDATGKFLKEQMALDTVKDTTISGTQSLEEMREQLKVQKEQQWRKADARRKLSDQNKSLKKLQEEGDKSRALERNMKTVKDNQARITADKTRAAGIKKYYEEKHGKGGLDSLSKHAGRMRDDKKSSLAQKAVGYLFGAIEETGRAAGGTLKTGLADPAVGIVNYVGQAGLSMAASGLKGMNQRDRKRIARRWATTQVSGEFGIKQGSKESDNDFNKRRSARIESMYKSKLEALNAADDEFIESAANKAKAAKQDLGNFVTGQTLTKFIATGETTGRENLEKEREKQNKVIHELSRKSAGPKGDDWFDDRTLANVHAVTEPLGDVLAEILVPVAAGKTVQFLSNKAKTITDSVKAAAFRKKLPALKETARANLEANSLAKANEAKKSADALAESNAAIRNYRQNVLNQSKISVKGEKVIPRPEGLQTTPGSLASEQAAETAQIVKNADRAGRNKAVVETSEAWRKQQQAEAMSMVRTEEVALTAKLDASTSSGSLSEALSSSDGTESISSILARTKSDEFKPVKKLLNKFTNLEQKLTEAQSRLTKLQDKATSGFWTKSRGPRAAWKGAAAKIEVEGWESKISTLRNKITEELLANIPEAASTVNVDQLIAGHLADAEKLKSSSFSSTLSQLTTASSGGFHAGGLIGGRPGVDRNLIRVTKGEAVVNAGQQAALASMAGGSVGGVFSSAGVPGFGANAANTSGAAKDGMRVKDDSSSMRSALMKFKPKMSRAKGQPFDVLRKFRPNTKDAHRHGDFAVMSPDSYVQWVEGVVKAEVAPPAAGPRPTGPASDIYRPPTSAIAPPGGTGGHGDQRFALDIVPGAPMISDEEFQRLRQEQRAPKPTTQPTPQPAPQPPPKPAPQPAVQQKGLRGGGIRQAGSGKMRHKTQREMRREEANERRTRGLVTGRIAPRSEEDRKRLEKAGKGGMSQKKLKEQFRADFKAGKVGKRGLPVAQQQRPDAGHVRPGPGGVPVGMQAPDWFSPPQQQQQQQGLNPAQQRAVAASGQAQAGGQGQQGQQGQAGGQQMPDIAAFSQAMTKLVEGVTAVGQSIGATIEKLAGFQLQHEHNHSGTINIEGVDAAKQAISDAIIQDVKAAIDEKINNLTINTNSSGQAELNNGGATPNAT